MILSFKNQFKKTILNGVKIHTIREDKRRRWKSGRLIHFATGVRTKKYHCFKTSHCISTQRIFMTYSSNDIIEVSVDGKYIDDVEKLAYNDGFKSYDEFFNWFYPLIMASEEQAFSAKIIHWTEFGY